MLQLFIRFPQFVTFTQFNEISAPFRENSNNHELHLNTASEHGFDKIAYNQ